MQRPEPIRRTLEIEDFTNLYFIHPISNRLTLFLRDIHVRPNSVSVIGMLCGLLAGLAYSHYQDWRWASAGFVLMIAWHVMDGADGQLARLTHSQSETGKVLDGICDYVTFIAVYASLAMVSSRQQGGLVWVLVVISGIFHAVQSAAYEVQREEYDFWGWGRESKDLLKSTAAPDDAVSASPLRRAARRLDELYRKIQHLAIGSTMAFHRQLAGRVSLRTDDITPLRQQYRRIFSRPVRHWSVLSANYRTIGIYLFAMLGLPLCYFVFEIVGLSLVLAILTHYQNRRYASFLKGLDTPRFGAKQSSFMSELGSQGDST